MRGEGLGGTLRPRLRNRCIVLAVKDWPGSSLAADILILGCLQQD